MRNWSEVSDRELSAEVLRLAYKVHSALGPGLLESVYQTCLAYELREAGMEIEVEKPIAITYRDTVMVEVGFRIDILVENRLVLELKSTEGNPRKLYRYSIELSTIRKSALWFDSQFW
jgi:GxxExxY protein